MKRSIEKPIHDQITELVIKFTEYFEEGPNTLLLTKDKAQELFGAAFDYSDYEPGERSYGGMSVYVMKGQDVFKVGLMSDQEHFFQIEKNEMGIVEK